MVDDDEKIAFLSRASLVDRLYKAILPGHPRQRVQPRASGVEIPRRRDRRVHRATRRLRRDGRVEQLLDESVAANEYLIPASDADALFDLGWCRLGRPRRGVQAGAAAHRRRAAPLAPFGTDHGARPAQPDARRPRRAIREARRRLQRRQHEHRGVLQGAPRVQEDAHRGGGSRALRRA